MRKGRSAAAVMAAALLLGAAAAEALAQDAEAIRREIEALDRRRAELVRQLRAAGDGVPAGEVPGAVPAGRGEEPAPSGEPEERETLLEAVEVVATRYAQARGDSPAPVAVVDGEWFETHQVSSVAEGLRQVPGVSVTRAGARGASTSLFLRGAGSNQVLVLQDGIPLNDPTVGGQFNFFDLDALDLERVEVLRGSYGALYGSDAIGGVVNLVTRRGTGPGTFRASAEAGSFRTQRQSLTGHGGDGDADWSVGAARTGSDGPSDRQEFDSRSFAGRFGARVGAEGRAEATVRYLDSIAQDPFDFGNPIPRDGNVERERELLALGLSWETPVARWLTTRVRASVTDIDSLFRNRGDAPGAPDEFSSAAEATTTVFGASALAAILEDGEDPFGLSFTGGFEYEEEESVNFTGSPFGGGLGVEDRTLNRGVYGLLTLTRGPVALVGGGRRDDHTQGGREWSPQAGARVEVERTGTTLRGNYGEGFRSPTPVEFTDPFVGNPGLGPERSVSFDAGVVQRIGGGVEVEAGWFLLRTRDLIAFDTGSFRLENLDRARVEGGELGVRADLGAGFRGRASFTRQRARDRATGERLPNRPVSFGGLGVEWTRGDWTVTGDLYAQGSVPSGGVTGPDARLREHPGRRTGVDLGVRWRAGEGVTVFGRVENLLDEEFVETPTAPKAPSRAGFLGVQVEF